MAQPWRRGGMIAEETGGLSFMGRANANVARMVVDEINTNGGLLGRKIELYLEDGATTDAVAEAKAGKRVPPHQVAPLIPSLMRKTGAKTFYLPSADYIWPHVMNERVRQLVTADGGR